MSSLTLHKIQDVPLFYGCRRSQLEVIDRLGTALVVHSGRTLCHEGEPGSEFFVLVDGLVEVQSSGGVLALMRGGAWFGEVALLHHTSRRATVRTVVDSELLVFSRQEFAMLCHAAHEVRERVEHTAALVARGEKLTAQPWYQPVIDADPAA